MKCVGYESYTSWIVTLGVCIINLLSQTPFRILGLMYVSILEYYQTDRESAAFPVLMFIIIRCISGPFCGILGEKLGAENVTLYGSVLACIGFGGCFFAESITGLTICLGIVFGLGMAGSNALLPSISKKYFLKNVNTANGIGQAGACIGAFLFPPIAVYFLNEYGLPGTFLILSALMLHSVPVSMLIRTAGFVQDKIIAATKRNNQKSLVDAESNKILEKNYTNKLQSLEKVDEYIEPEKGVLIVTYDPGTENCNTDSLKETAVINISHSQTLPNENEEMNNEVDSLLLKTKQLDINEKNSETLNVEDEIALKLPEFKSDLNVNGVSSVVSTPPSVISTTDLKQTDIEKKPLTDHVDTQLKSSNISSSIQQNKSNLLKKSKLHYLKVFLNRPFLIIMLITGLQNYVAVLFCTTIIDYSRDKGISRTNEVYFLMMHPLCEIIGRTGFGWVTDFGYLTLSQFSMIAFILMGFSCGSILWSAEFWIMILGAMTFAISGGAMTAVLPGMVFACVPEELHNMAIASRYALTGPLLLSSAPLIGLFRGTIGSYDGFYYLLIAICAVCVALMPVIDSYSSQGKRTRT